MVLGHSISVCDLLKHLGHGVALEVGRRFDQVVVVAVSAEHLKFGSRKLVQSLFNGFLHFDWSPEEGNVIGSLHLHHVQRGVDCLLLQNKPLIDRERAHTLADRVCLSEVDVVEVRFELKYAVFVQVSGLCELVIRFAGFFRDLVQFRDLKDVSIER